MNIYDDTPETAPRVQTPRGGRNAATRAFRSSYEYQTAQKQFRAQAALHRNPDGTIGEHCWLCGEAVNYMLKSPHPRSWCLDHAIPVSQQPKLALDSRNFRSAHRSCNEYRGTGEPPIDLGEPSEVW
jgi:hypothetical protein